MVEQLLIATLLHAGLTADSAHLSGQLLVVEPIGISFRIPPVWLGMPVPTGRDYLCANSPAGTVADRIVTEPARFRSLRGPAGEWKTEFSAVIDSVLPFGDLVAHLGGDPWRGTCGAMQMRVYVGARLAQRVVDADAGRRAAMRYFRPVTRTQVDSAGWHITRLEWNAWYYDYGGPARVEFWARSFANRDLVLVFMLSGYNADQFLDRTDIIDSVRRR